VSRRTASIAHTLSELDHEAEAIRDIEAHAIKMGLMPIDWSAPDEKLMIGRTHKPAKPDLTYVVLVRSGQLPQGWRLIPTDEPLR
jgi:hypothetical protein